MSTKHKHRAGEKVPLLSREEAYQIGVEAYLYFYPLVTMDTSRRQGINIEAGQRPGFGPKNTFHHLRAFPSADYKAIVRVNFDTLYSSTWLDLTSEPMILSVPDTHGRYYLLEMLDMWTDVFAVPGSRTTGTRANHFAVVTPSWRGELPSGFIRIEAPTPWVWIIGRTQTNGPADYQAVHQVQDGYTITPLSQWGKVPRPFSPQHDPSVDVETPALELVNHLSPAAYFNYAARLLKENPPHLTDWSQLARLKRIGLESDGSFTFEQLDSTIKHGLERAAADALDLMRARSSGIAKIVNGWQMNIESMGVFGNNYLKRAIIAMVGLGANPPEDAVYPFAVADRDNQPITGEHDYMLHFSKEELPPVGAFWSLTMYDGEGFQAANELNRFALGDRDPLRYNADGSLDLFIQHERPTADREANWLPAPHGPLGLTLRLYAPHTSVLDGRWVPPAIQRVK